MPARMPDRDRDEHRQDQDVQRVPEQAGRCRRARCRSGRRTGTPATPRRSRRSARYRMIPPSRSQDQGGSRPQDDGRQSVGPPAPPRRRAELRRASWLGGHRAWPPVQPADEGHEQHRDQQQDQAHRPEDVVPGSPKTVLPMSRVIWLVSVVSGWVSAGRHHRPVADDHLDGQRLTGGARRARARSRSACRPWRSG